MKCERSAATDVTKAATTAAANDETRHGDDSVEILDDFVARVAQARLLPPAILAAAIEDSAASNFESYPPGERLRRYLLEHNLLSSGQMARLDEGHCSGVFLGPYQLLKAIGAGGTSRVYLAEHVQIQRRVALKVLIDRAAEDPGVCRRFLREAHVFMSLNHPNIVRAYQYDESHGRAYLAMEHVEGENLRDLVVRGGALSYKLAASYVAQAAGALGHLHSLGYVHRDVKPANLLVTKEHQVKLIDLGLVCGGPSGPAVLASDDAHSSGGSVDYIAPEQISRFHEVDHRADLYGLGCTLYCLLTGAAPFPGGNAADKLHKHVHASPKPIESIRRDAPQFLIELCNKLMAKDPNQRVESAAEVHRLLLEWLKAQKTAQPGAIAEVRFPTPAPTKAKPAAAQHPASKPAAKPAPKSSAPDQAAGPIVLDVAETAALLRMPKAVIEEMAAEGLLPGRAIGGEWRFHRRAILEWLNEPSVVASTM